MSQASDRTKVDLNVLHDRRLSLKARGIYSLICYLQQHQGIRHPTIEDVCLHSDLEQRDAVGSGMRELRALGAIPLRPNPGTAHKPGWVYVIQAVSTDFYKIGAAGFIPQRLNRLIPQSPFPLSLAASVFVSDMATVEDDLHQRFSSQRGNGEWFSLNQADLDWIAFHFQLLEREAEE